MKKSITFLFATQIFALSARAIDVYALESPDSRLKVNVCVGRQITYDVSYNGHELLSSSSLNLNIKGRNSLCRNAKVKKATLSGHNGTIIPTFYIKDKIEDNYKTLDLQFDGFKLQFRAYNEGAAYRFVTQLHDSITVMDERAEFNFLKGWDVYASYSNAKGSADHQLSSSYENTYVKTPLPRLNTHDLIMLPFLVCADNGVKILITESNLEDYPGMYIRTDLGRCRVRGTFARYPKEIRTGNIREHNKRVLSREDYLVRTKGGRAFPWRIIRVATDDKQLLNDDMVYRLADPVRISDISWIKPGKTAWDWWNNFGLKGVSFKTGSNLSTYKHYVDFASKHNLEYVILDEGWSNYDLFHTNPNIHLDELISYARQKNVGLILWAGFRSIDGQLEKVFKYYSEKGIKGFKLDFIDRDDAQAVNFEYAAARLAAKYHLIIDFHGTYKPTGMCRTYPNVLNYEAVDGQEQTKWSTIQQYDQVTYVVTIPFIRQVAGPMDFTGGAMHNSTRDSYGTSYDEPVSQGTRCMQLAEYIIFHSPLNMLCDSPTNYEANPESLDFIAGIPTVWDETVPLDSKVGEYLAIARRKGNDWYVAAMTDWTARDMTLDLTFLPSDDWHGIAFKDGPNADRSARDYVREEFNLPSTRTLKIHLAPGGGYALHLTRK